jgi:hypothetical protein
LLLWPGEPASPFKFLDVREESQRRSNRDSPQKPQDGSEDRRLESKPQSGLALAVPASVTQVVQVLATTRQSGKGAVRLKLLENVLQRQVLAPLGSGENVGGGGSGGLLKRTKKRAIVFVVHKAEARELAKHLNKRLMFPETKEG